MLAVGKANAPVCTAAGISEIKSVGCRPFKGSSKTRCDSITVPTPSFCVSTCVALASTASISTVHAAAAARVQFTNGDVQIIGKDNIARAAKLGVVVATQPSMQYAFGPVLVKRFGTVLMGQATPVRGWLDGGVTVGGGKAKAGLLIWPFQWAPSAFQKFNWLAAPTSTFWWPTVRPTSHA